MVTESKPDATNSDEQGNIQNKMAGETSKNPRLSSENTKTVLAIESLRNEIVLMRKDFEYLREDVAEVKKASCDGMDDINKILKEFRVTLYGNGNVEEPGIVAIVGNIKKFVEDRRFYERLLAGAFIGETVGLIFLIIKDFFGH